MGLLDETMIVKENVGDMFDIRYADNMEEVF